MVDITQSSFGVFLLLNLYNPDDRPKDDGTGDWTSTNSTSTTNAESTADQPSEVDVTIDDQFEFALYRVQFESDLGDNSKKSLLIEMVEGFSKVCIMNSLTLISRFRKCLRW